ncbi:MAG TPA: serine hydrolase domain-containing protein [Candidatus Dormibacteraeota bacterium]|nr:serine hydrolase domain-containing protein [Candidatus Dormibacteraeota bacterium]
MRGMRLLTLVLLAAIVSASCSTAAKTSSADTESATLNRLANHDFFGGSVLVARQGKVLLQGGFGLADRALRTPNTPTTRFRIGSVSKQFTAMAILMLEKRNHLHVSDPVCAHLAPCPQAWEQVTIQQLLNHTAGIENYPYDQSDAPDRFYQPVTPAEQVAQAGERPLLSRPGTEWLYCNVCYAALGLVVERESGTNLTQFLKTQIFDPLAMRDTGIDQGQSIPREALGYTRRGTLGPAYRLDLSWAYGAGQMYSTVGDLYRWDQALYRDQLLGGGTSAQLMRNAASTGAVGQQYANGWFIDSIRGHSRVRHGGSIPGFISDIDRFPDDRAVVIVLTNLDGFNELEQVTSRLDDWALSSR